MGNITLDFLLLQALQIQSQVALDDRAAPHPDSHLGLHVRLAATQGQEALEKQPVVLAREALRRQSKVGTSHTSCNLPEAGGHWAG